MIRNVCTYLIRKNHKALSALDLEGVGFFPVIIGIKGTGAGKAAEVFHCEPIEKVADDFIQKNSISDGHYDNVAECRYTIPDYWDIGEVFARLIEDCYEGENLVNGIKEVYGSWMADQILNFNSDLYYQSREYIALCYKEGKMLLA